SIRRHSDGTPLPLWERPDRIERCDSGEGFVSTVENPGLKCSPHARREPPHPARSEAPRHLLPQGEKEASSGQTDAKLQASFHQQVYLPCRPPFCCILAQKVSETTAMVPFFVQFKGKLGQPYAVANALAEAEIASEIYSTAGDFDLLVKFYVDNDT